MAPKKGKAKKEEVQDKPKDELTEVDKTFYELQIADLNRKLARLRSQNDELEIKNAELQSEYKKLDEDRGDVIAYLKKSSQIKIDETIELQERIRALEEKRRAENTRSHTKIKELQKEFDVMKEQLTSEVKLLTGKLNSLEEFRLSRDQLMEKFEKQERDFENQEKFYKNKLYEVEKEFIVGKDKLKKEMERKLLKLSEDFQNATELRIASSTHRVVRENIAVNNELKNMITIQKQLVKENNDMMSREKSAKLKMQLMEEERDKTTQKNIIQEKIIEKLVKEYNVMKEKVTSNKDNQFNFETQENKIGSLTEELEGLRKEMLELKEISGKMSEERNHLKSVAGKTSKNIEILKTIIEDAHQSVSFALKMCESKFDGDEAEKEAVRRDLLYQLLQILSIARLKDLTSDESASQMPLSYECGDLGFISKVVAAEEDDNKVIKEAGVKIDSSCKMVILSPIEKIDDDVNDVLNTELLSESESHSTSCSEDKI